MRLLQNNKRLFLIEIHTFFSLTHELENSREEVNVMGQLIEAAADGLNQRGHLLLVATHDIELSCSCRTAEYTQCDPPA